MGDDEEESPRKKLRVEQVAEQVEQTPNPPSKQGSEQALDQVMGQAADETETPPVRKTPGKNVSEKVKAFEKINAKIGTGQSARGGTPAPKVVSPAPANVQKKPEEARLFPAPEGSLLAKMQARGTLPSNDGAFEQAQQAHLQSLAQHVPKQPPVQQQR